jgi:hypothetical protein
LGWPAKKTSKNIKKTIPFAFQFWKMLAPSPQKVLQLLLRLAIFDEVRTSANPFVNSKSIRTK